MAFLVRYFLRGILAWQRTCLIEVYTKNAKNHHDQQLVRLVVKVFPPNSKSKEQKMGAGHFISLRGVISDSPVGEGGVLHFGINLVIFESF